MADLVDFFLDSEPVKTGEWKAQEQADSAFEHEESVTKRFLYFLARPLDYCRIGNAPMRRHRLTGPERADLLCGIVTDSKDKIELGSIRFRKFVPVLAPEAGG